MASLFGLRSMSESALRDFLKQADSMLEVLGRPVAKVPALRGKRVALLFFEPSTRTRMSFELAAKSLGADVINFSTGNSSLSKGESLLDTAMTVKALGADCVVVRDTHARMPEFLAKHLELAVVNAGDGANEHPTQALLDLAVLNKVWNGEFKGKTLAIVGDIGRSRVARSHFWAAEKLGINIRVIAPDVFLEPGFQEAFSVSIFSSLEDGLKDVDAVMALRVQTERRGEGGPYLASAFDYFSRYGITKQRLESLAPNAFLLHPGPVNRAVELAPDLLYADKSLIQDQVQMGVAVRMAVLYWALGCRDE